MIRRGTLIRVPFFMYLSGLFCYLSLMESEMNKNMFASDNYSSVCPEVWSAMEQANSGYANSYGDDFWTEKACDALRDFF